MGDGQWIPQQQAVGLVRASFRPPQEICAVGAIVRHREIGVRIRDATVEGERDARKLAKLRDYRIRTCEKTVSKAVEGDYREEQRFTLRQSLERYRFRIQQTTESA